MKKPQLYLETSVWNFYFADDAPEKRDITCEFFQCIAKGFYDIFISQTVLDEIARADEAKQIQLMELIKEHNPKELDIEQEVTDLSKEYIGQGIIPQKKFEDALHVAVATVFEMDALITWNNRHIANLRKMEKSNSVNLREGYTKHIELVNPMEVVNFDED
jgi:predicted nucleic acid-binding protein